MADDRSDEREPDLTLAPELARCQAHLARQALPPSRLDRDQLLYRAGWAAAEARGSEAQGSRQGRRTGWVWTLTSAAAAASIAAVITSQLQRPDGTPTSPHGGDAPPVTAVTGPAELTGPTLDPQIASSPVDPPHIGGPPRGPIVTITAQRWTAPMLSLRDRMLAGRWEDLPPPGETEPGTGRSTLAPQQQPTARQLLHDLLEARSGEVPRTFYPSAPHAPTHSRFVTYRVADYRFSHHRMSPLAFHEWPHTAAFGESL